MLESLLPLLAVVAEPIPDAELIEDYLAEGYQVVHVTVDRPVGETYAATGDIDQLVLRTCDGDQVQVPVSASIDLVDGLGVALEPQLDVCGVRVVWDSALDLVVRAERGTVELEVRDPFTSVRLLDGRGRSPMRRWRVVKGMTRSRVAPLVRAEVLEPEPEPELDD